MTTTDFERLVRFVFFFVAITLIVRGETTRRTFLEEDMYLKAANCEASTKHDLERNQDSHCFGPYHETPRKERRLLLDNECGIE